MEEASSSTGSLGGAGPSVPGFPPATESLLAQASLEPEKLALLQSQLQIPSLRHARVLMQRSSFEAARPISAEFRVHSFRVICVFPIHSLRCQPSFVCTNNFVKSLDHLLLLPFSSIRFFSKLSILGALSGVSSPISLPFFILFCLLVIHGMLKIES
ncbi:hypothetical protein CAEBREN_06369 [Caenorhabditis brenneri]|uniref:Uncharacterized protein n=1 Tax=Caenorhabditis brenneri TaxID=135651 RepID=G0MHG3_CAEBE|nr:hypothetical protein CAEBREN_06369 [Caenorhabditis brenneri]